MLKSRFLAASALAGTMLLAPVASFAQAAAPVESAIAQAPDQQTPEQESEAQSIVVTGSRIRRPNLDSPVPVAVVTGQEFFETGAVSIGDVLNDLPQLRSTYSQSNSSRFLGTAGLNLLDLRGLGTQRTLVLVNGRRHVGADVLGNAVSPDVNTFPTDLIERTEVVTGGDSAIYGSDAIAGVVNFILKQDFDGLQIRGQGGISQYGDAGAYYTSVLAGKNFAEGRGNIAVNLEYARQNDFYASDRSYLNRQDGFVIVDQDLASDANFSNGGDGVPDRTFFRDIRSATYSNGGLVSFPSPTGRCGRDSILNATTGLGRTFTCNYVFDPSGNLVPQTGQRVGLGSGSGTPSGSFIGGNGSNFRDGRQLGILPRLDRYSANLIGHFDISEALVPFIEAKYVRTDSLGSASGPAFFNGATLGDSRERPRLDNPYLSAQARSVITSQLLLANPNAVITDSTQFSLRKNLTDLGVRQEAARRETYRIVGGLRGDFNDDWHYELSGNYGVFKEATKVLGNLNIQRYLLAADSARNPATGQIVCRSQIDPTAGIGYIDEGATLANDIATCVPINPFGEGNITQAARNYVIQDTISHGKITQLVGSGFVSGDLSQLFELPGGPIGFSAGGEYRRETVDFRADPLVEQGYTFYNALSTFSPPSFEVKELYGELRVPLLANMPFFQELTLTGAGRVADYKGSAGTVYSYNGGAEWSPVRGIRFRGNYSRAVRAPNLSDLYSPLGQNFATVVDPCAQRNINTGSATRVANCAAAGVPAAYDYLYQSSLEIQSGGNTGLKAEKSDSYTLGAVLQPAFARGLGLTVDYYTITVDDVITAPTAQQIIDACYDAIDLNNQFCGLFQRAGAGGGANGEEANRIIEGSLQQTLLNYAKLKARGIDATLSYRNNIADIGDFNTSFTYTHVLQRDEFLNPADPGRANRILSELGDPKDSFNWNVNLKVGKVSLGYQMRYIGKMVLNTYEDIFSVQGRAPENSDYADSQFYPSATYHDFRIAADITEGTNMYLGLENIGNKKPPFAATGTGAGSGIYQVRGRYLYVGAVAKF